MRTLKIIIALFVCLGPYSIKAQDLDSKDKKEVYQTIVLVGTAWTHNNLDTLDKYIHKDYVHTDVRGEVFSRAAWLNYVKDRKEKGVSNPGVEFEDIKITIFHEFAFVTGINTFSGQAYTSNDTNSNKPRKLRFTQVLIKENNIWKRLLFQATYIEADK